jgi:hypothetical protein
VGEPRIAKDARRGAPSEEEDAAMPCLVEQSDAEAWFGGREPAAIR